RWIAKRLGCEEENLRHCREALDTDRREPEAAEAEEHQGPFCGQSEPLTRLGRAAPRALRYERKIDDREEGIHLRMKRQPQRVARFAVAGRGTLGMRRESPVTLRVVPVHPLPVEIAERDARDTGAVGGGKREGGNVTEHE